MRFSLFLCCSVGLHLLLFWPAPEATLPSLAPAGTAGPVRVRLATAEQQPVAAAVPPSLETPSPAPKVVETPPPPPQPEKKKSRTDVKPPRKQAARHKEKRVPPPARTRLSPPPVQPAPVQSAPIRATAPSAQTNLEPVRQAAPVKSGSPGRELTLGEENAPSYARFVPPVYPEQARRRGLQGTVLLRVLIGEDGKAHEVEILSCSHPLFAASARQSATRSTYVPYRSNGAFHAGRVQIPVRFELR